MAFRNARLTSTIPLNYRRPSFPSLYWPINPLPSQAHYLYYPTDIWKFTLFWTLITYAVCFGIVGVWGWVMVASGSSKPARRRNQRRSGSRGGIDGESSAASLSSSSSRSPPRKNPGKSWFGDWWYGGGWLVSVMIVGGVEAVIGGSIVGLILAAVYNAGFFRMSTWIPCVWGVINIIVLILSSFSLQGGM